MALILKTRALKNLNNSIRPFWPVSDRWISLVLIICSKVATHTGLSAPVEITYIIRFALNNAIDACMVASDPYRTVVHL